MGQVTAVTDPLNRTTQSTYDQLGRRLSVVNALGATNGFEYNVFGNLTELTDANGNQTGFDYDLNGRLTKKTYADSSFWQYEYDAVGGLIKRTDAKDQITAYSYDLLSRLATNSYYPSSSSYPSSPSKVVAFSYDFQGRMTGWNDGQYSGLFSYDDTNRIRHVTVDYGPWTKSYSYHYDLAGQKTKFTGPDNVEIGYSYNAEGRLNGINIPGEGSLAFGANQYGLLSSQALPGGNTRSYSYNPLMSLVTNVALDSAQNMLMSRYYERNQAGNITGQLGEAGTNTYAYDAIDQLIASTNSVLGNEQFVYDSMGNRLSSVTPQAGTTNEEHRTYSVNSLNQYTTIVATTNGASITNYYSYDFNGNLTNEASNVKTNTYSWDIENRQVGYSKQEGTNLISAQYTYDVFGRRLSKAVNGITNYFLYADEGLIGEFDASGNETKSYGYKPNASWMNDPVFLRQSGGATNYYYFVNDHLGAPQKLVAKNGSVVWSLVYDAFGRAEVSSNSTIVCNLRFSSQYYDEESGLNYNDQRYFDPVNGRYTSEDPLSDSGSMAWIQIKQRVLQQLDYIILLQARTIWTSDYSSMTEAIDPIVRLKALIQFKKMIMRDNAILKAYLIGANEMGFANNNPLSHVDRMGLSPEDVQNIIDAFYQIIDQMTENGYRPEGATTFWHNALSLAGIYMDCAGQSEYLINEISPFLLGLDDNWLPPVYSGHIWRNQQGELCWQHHWVEIVPANLTDPVIILDPWRLNVFLRPPLISETPNPSQEINIGPYITAPSIPPDYGTSQYNDEWPLNRWPFNLIFGRK